jgi:hypothetical protein
MNGSRVTTGWRTSPSKLARWAYLPRRRLLFIVIESWAALAAEVVAIVLQAGIYPSILIQIASLSTGALLANRALRKPEEERAQEELEQDTAILEQLRLSPDCVEKEKLRLFHSYRANVKKVRTLRAVAPRVRRTRAVRRQEGRMRFPTLLRGLGSVL